MAQNMQRNFEILTVGEIDERLNIGSKQLAYEALYKLVHKNKIKETYKETKYWFRHAFVMTPEGFTLLEETIDQMIPKINKKESSLTFKILGYTFSIKKISHEFVNMTEKFPDEIEY